MSEPIRDECLIRYREQATDIAEMFDAVMAAPAVPPALKQLMPLLVRDVAYLTLPRLYSQFLRQHPTDPTKMMLYRLYRYPAKKAE